ncbi:hypothetical protein NHQ30_011470 [Ciborinia camelliae]|nr:hypothetical protein NHQ30_011470 [Ciborinia camelliae]
MHSIGNLFVLLASAVAAVPVNNIPPPPQGRVPNLPLGNNSCATPSLPVNGGAPASALPAPTGTLAYVALGRGIQNYTCSAVGATPVALGAVASLYDATELATCAGTEFNNLPNVAVYATLFRRQRHAHFDLASVSKILYAAKTGDVAAPVTANRGPADTGAVDWLSLVAKVSYTSVGLTQVYRVETAGGNSINPCSTAGVESVQYAAQYWFYS